MDHLTFTRIGSDAEIPYDLLLLADETVEAINQYIFTSEVYLLNNGDQDIAAMVLHENSATEIELKNIAVTESWQNKGIGSILIDKAKELATEKHYTSLLVGTSDTGLRQIRFYEKNGFIKKGIRKDFFIENYPFPIYENGEQMRDMVMLELLIIREH